ncbi:uncharacterized protein LOC124317315 isoform X2 [Daphnia pulicaria]|uniref:uncharacterized protein LOC124317315 isoform X2 n=1 Tax=Daphnia pulicaria TaxID=35523 RepID=UPI001EEADAE6|nr:uncharacterized protein LOC124317315 isoform X2 [Daphnia pulicaria]
MDFTLEEVRGILDEMGLKNVPDNHLEQFAKDLKHLMKHEKHVQKRKRAEGEFTVPPSQPVINLPTIRLPASEVPTSSTATRHQPMVVRPSASFYPSCPEVNFDLVATGKKLPTERAPKVVKNEAVKSASATTSASKAEHDRAKLQEAQWKKLKTDPVKLYGWYKTHWDYHGLDKNPY